MRKEAMQGKKISNFTLRMIKNRRGENEKKSSFGKMTNI